jgi:hypothetical protein
MTRLESQEIGFDSLHEQNFVALHSVQTGCGAQPVFHPADVLG